MVDALNALAPIPVAGGGRHLYAQGLLICSSRSRIRRSLFSRASIDSYDPISAFEATVDIGLWRSRV